MHTHTSDTHSIVMEYNTNLALITQDIALLREYNTNLALNTQDIVLLRERSKAAKSEGESGQGTSLSADSKLLPHRLTIKDS